MNREDIIRMARESCDHTYTNRFIKDEPAFAFSTPALERFAELVAAAEREACTKVVEDEWSRWAIPVTTEEYNHMWCECAKAIRARGQQENKTEVGSE